MKKRFVCKACTLLMIVLAAAVSVSVSCGGGGGSGGPTPEKDAWTWTRLLGEAGASITTVGISVDAAGNCYAAGYTDGNLDGQSKTGSLDLFVVKYNANGVKLWTKLLGVSGILTYASGISVDKDGNSYVTGCTSGNLSGETKTGTFDLFVVKYDTNGTIQWTRLLGVSGILTYAYGISVDKDGNCYATGYTYGNLDGQSKTGILDLFVVKYNANGVKLWTKLLGVSGASTYAYGISVDKDGNCYATGYTYGNLDGQSKTGSLDLFVVKYNANGDKQWTKLLGVSGASTYAYGISVDKDGNCYATGYANGNLSGETKTGTFDLFVVKYDTNGVIQWTRLLGVSGAETCGNGISVDAAGNCYVAGYTDGNLDGQSKTGSPDLCVVKYNTSGIKQWTRLLGVSGAETYGNGISVDAVGNCYVAGYTYGNLDGQTLKGISDMFVTTLFND